MAKSRENKFYGMESADAEEGAVNLSKQRKEYDDDAGDGWGQKRATLMNWSAPGFWGIY